MNQIEEIILSSVLQAEGETLTPYLGKFLDGCSGDSIAFAVAGASASGKIAPLIDIAALLPSSEIIRLSSLHVANGLPIALAELEAETLVNKKKAEEKSKRLAELAQQAIDQPGTGSDIAEELAELCKPKVGEETESEMERDFKNGEDRWEELFRNKGKNGLATGFTMFDRISGGLKPGHTTVIAAETGGCKSTFALNVMNHALIQGKGVLLFTLEMERSQIIDLLVSMNCRVNRNGFNTGDFKEGELKNIIANKKRILKYKLWIDDNPTRTASEIASRMRQMAGKVDLVIVDYLQIVEPFDLKENREQQVSGIARTLRKAAKETKITTLALSQLNEEGKMRESRAVAQEADNILMLKADQSKLEFKIVKGRFIPRGEVFHLDYEPEFCSLKDAARVTQEDGENWQSNRD